MKRLSSSGLTLLFGVAVFLFWRLRYPFALTYQEQLQLFLFDDGYFLSRMAEPGGLARYVAEFLVQFYNGVTIGALIIAVLFMLLQRLIVALGAGRFAAWYPLSFVPVLLIWYAMGDESVLLTYVVALALILVFSTAWVFFSNGLGRYFRWTLLAVLIPLIYWLTGPLVLLFAVIAMPLSVVWAVAVILASAWVLPYPLLRLTLGVGYYRFPETLPYALMLVPLLIAALYYAVPRLPRAGRRAVVAQLVGLVLLMLLPPYGFDDRKYELIEYDQLVRVGDWDAIVAKAERKSPDLPMSVCANNLALAMKNQLGERAFDFYQHGSEGLLPRFERNFATTQLTGEVYFRLGLVNTAQRLAFEAMEAIPNYNKSARAVKRLAETNLINGDYPVARKYLRMLEKTVFYRLWAQRTLAMLDRGEQQINAHPLYGVLRQYRLPDDFLFSDRELDRICGQLVVHNPKNQLAVQYLLMLPLLDRDVPRFMQYVQYVQNRVPYNPRVVQEAVAFAFMQQRQQPPRGVVSPIVLQRMNEFARAWSSGGQKAGLEPFRNTAWYYLVKN